VPRLARQLAAQPSVEATQLELEILETGALNNMAHVSRLIAQLHGMGVACALDDFGTGYSSLTFLKQLAVQTIKIDQSFVRGMLDDSEHASIVNSVLGLARSFDRRTLAEGVETEAHGQMLVELGCEMAQGYAIARPMPAEAVNDWLDQWVPPRSWQTTTPLEQGDVPLLMGEVEHRAWIKALKIRLFGPHENQPGDSSPVGSEDCRFSGWLSKRSTRQRYSHLSDFENLVQQHNALHTMGIDLLHQTDAQRPSGSTGNAWRVALGECAQTQTAWHKLQTQSAALLAALQGMRENNEELTLSAFSEQ
jgi:hypothetical protein